MDAGVVVGVDRPITLAATTEIDTKDTITTVVLDTVVVEVVAAEAAAVMEEAEETNGTTINGIITRAETIARSMLPINSSKVSSPCHSSRAARMQMPSRGRPKARARLTRIMVVAIAAPRTELALAKGVVRIVINDTATDCPTFTQLGYVFRLNTLTTLFRYLFVIIPDVGRFTLAPMGLAVSPRLFMHWNNPWHSCADAIQLAQSHIARLRARQQSLFRSMIRPNQRLLDTYGTKLPRVRLFNGTILSRGRVEMGHFLYRCPHLAFNDIIGSIIMPAIGPLEEQHQRIAFLRPCARDWLENSHADWTIFHSQFPFDSLAGAFLDGDISRGVSLATIYEAMRQSYFESMTAAMNTLERQFELWEFPDGRSDSDDEVPPPLEEEVERDDDDGLASTTSEESGGGDSSSSSDESQNVPPLEPPHWIEPFIPYNENNHAVDLMMLEPPMLENQLANQRQREHIQRRRIANQQEDDTSIIDQLERIHLANNEPPFPRNINAMKVIRRNYQQMRAAKRVKLNDHTYSSSEPTVASRAEHPMRCELDNHADTTCCGANFRPLIFTGQSCEVKGFQMNVPL